MNADGIKKLLCARYCQPEWALAFEVADQTGQATGYADAIAMSMYPSRGLEINGFEIKVSRGDMATEMKNPDKAEKFARYCDKWWLVVPKELASKAALDGPDAWGVIAAYDSGQLRTIKPAIKTPAKDLDRPIVAALFRRLSMADKKKIDAEVRERVDQASKRISERHEARQKQTLVNFTESGAEKVEAIEAALGFDVTGWGSHKELCAAIRAVHRLQPENTYAFSASLAGLEDKAKAVVEIAAEFRALVSAKPEGGEA